MMKIKPDNKKSAILLVMLEAAEGEEQELHDWYDFEHIPERAAVKGFSKLQRYVCLEGWPRFMALYDLDSLDVLKTKEYELIVGDNYSPWSKRVIGKARGWIRSEAELVEHGSKKLDLKVAPLRMMVVSYTDVQSGDIASLDKKIKAYTDQRSDVLQSRVFRVARDKDRRLYALIELNAPRSLKEFDWDQFIPKSGQIDIANIYTRYWRAKN